MVIFKTNEFIEYLEYIVIINIYNNLIFIIQGIITKETSPFFNDKMKQNIKNVNNEVNIPELMINILCEYLKGLNDENIKYISSTIMNNFILYKQKMITKKINTIFIIYTKQELLSMREKLFQWRQNIFYNISRNNSKIDIENNSRDNYFHLNLNVGPIMNNTPGVPIIINNNSNNSNNNINNNHINNSNINNSNINISEINNENDFKNKKSFIRNNNSKNNAFKSNYSTINYSSSNYSTIPKGKQRPYSSEASIKNKNHIPIPNDPKDEKSLILDKMRKYKNDSQKIVNKFIKRQEKYVKKNSKKKQKIINDNEEEYKLIYTFEPKVNESLRKLYKKDKISASNRLYNDSIVRKNKILEQEINFNNNNNSQILSGKSFNKNKYIELYEDSKIRKEKKEELIKKIEKECGYTYAPIINKNYESNYNGENIRKIINKKNGNKSFSQIKIQKDNKNKNFKKLEKNNSCSKLITLIKKKDIKKNENNNKANKINGILK